MSEHQNEVQDKVPVFSFRVKIKRTDIEIQALTKDGYFRKDLSFCILILTNITSVQYCGGCSVLWGDSISTCGGIVSVLQRLFSTVGE